MAVPERVSKLASHGRDTPDDHIGSWDEYVPRPNASRSDLIRSLEQKASETRGKKDQRDRFLVKHADF